MSTLMDLREELKKVLRGLIISAPLAITVDQLQKDYRQAEGRAVPFRELGYPTFMKFLESISDAVVVRPSSNGGSPIVVAVHSDKTSHIASLVQKQKVRPPKGSSQMRPHELRRSHVQATPPMNSTHYSMNYKNSDMKQRICIPINLQEEICAMVYESPKGVPVQAIERKFLSSHMRKNFGIDNGCNVHQLLSCLGHLLTVSNEVVYPIQNKTAPSRPILGKTVTERQTSNFCNSQTYSFMPAGYEGEIFEISKQNGTLSVDDEVFGEISNNDDTDIAEAIYKPTEVTGIVGDTQVSPSMSLTCDTEDLKVIPVNGLPSDNTGTYVSDFTSNLISKKMKMNFQTLLDKHPNGIWCSELPDLYKKEFAVVLEYANLGFVSVIHMASNLSDVFHCIRPDGDWKLFDARKKLPPQYSAYDIKFNKDVSRKMVPTAPSKVALNINKLLIEYPVGIPSEQIHHLYEKEFLATLNVQEMGFDSIESLLLSMHESVLHVRYVGKKILVYPIARDTEPEEGNPLPHVTEPQDYYSSYPPEVVGPKETLTQEKIPPEAAPGGFVEVLVAEIRTPLNFWILLRGENTHMALDRLMNDMQLFYLQEADNYNMPVVTVRIGQYCVAPYNGEWHRACITAVHNFVFVQVLFVDYGTTSRVKKSELRFLHADFAGLPTQAIKASLSNLVPFGGGKKWPCQATERFLDLVANKSLVAVVSSVDHEARELEVSLADTSGNEDVHINDVLVKEGLAEYKTNRPPSPLLTQPKRIDADPALSTVTVSRPPPGFAAISNLHNQPFLSPTSSAANGQSSYVPEMQVQSYPQLSQQNLPMTDIILSNHAYVPEMQGQSHPLTLLPTFPVANAIPSNFIPQPTDISILPIICDVPLHANTLSLVSQSMLQHCSLYEHVLQPQPLLRSFSFIVPPSIASVSLVNPYIMPVLTPPVMYSPTPVSEEITSVRQAELGISRVTCMPAPQKNISGQISPDTGHIAAAAGVLTDSSSSTYATSGTHTATKVPTSIMSPGVSHLSASINTSPKICIADVHCDKDRSSEAAAFLKEEMAVGNEVLNNMPSSEFSCGSYQSDDTLLADSHRLESESDLGFDSQYVTEDGESVPDLSPNSDEIYRSDDEDDDGGGEELCEQPKQSTLRNSEYVEKIEIAGRVLHLVKILNTAFLCTDEVVGHFTGFSGRHVVLKMLDSRGVKIPFCEIERRHSPAIIDDLEAYNVVGVAKSPDGFIIDKVHLTPLTSVTHLIPFLNVEDQEEFGRVVSLHM